MPDLPQSNRDRSLLFAQTQAHPDAAALPVTRTPSAISGRFTLGVELGAGGMGRVYRAFDHELDEEVALKILHVGGGIPAQLREQLRREVKATRRVVSPHVVRIYECGIDDGSAWFSMELLEGGSLVDLLRRSGRLSSAQVRAIGFALCDGLTAAHAAGVIHRDLKPGNVLVSGERVAICDFGLAHLDWHKNQSSSAVGTPAYFAPEQMSGQRVTPATDLFALGVMLYELATGRLPWLGDSLMALAMARLNEPVRDPREWAPDVSDDVVQLILECLQFEPQKRPQSALAVAQRLRVSQGSPGRLPSTPHVLPPSAVAASRPNPESSRLIVLPFASIGPASELALGLAEDITAALIPHKQLRAVAARVARAYANEQRDPAEIGRSIGVDYVVDGSVRKLDDGVRIHATLTACFDDRVVLSRTLNCDAARARQVHDEIAFAVAQELIAGANRVKTTPEVTDPEVLRAYVSGRRGYNDAMASFSPDKLRDAIGHLERAAELAPMEPLVAAGLAIAVSGQLGVEAVISTGLLNRAQRLALQAIDLAPNSGEAWLARGLADLHSGQPVAAAVAFRRAVSLAPSLPEPRAELAALLADAGWLPQARQQLEVALELGGDASAILGELARVAVLEDDVAARVRARKLVEARGLPTYASWRGVYSGALATNNQALLLETYREMIAPQAAPLPPFIDALRIVLGSVLKETPPDAHLALLPQITWNEGATAMRRCRSLLLLMELRKGEAAGEWFLETLRQVMDLGLCNAVWFARATCLDGIRDRPEFEPLRRVIEKRRAEIFDAYCGDANSQPSQPVGEAMATEGF